MGVDGLQTKFTCTDGVGNVFLPDPWQLEAVSALRAGKDVVVQAPTGAGKTLIFELWSDFGKNKGQAVYTVPTRALANDKLAEWRRAGWNVGISTGDLSDNLEAPVLVATLETQKNRIIRGEGPKLLVIDEYQMIADPDRGLNYEIVIALAPPHTQLLLLSGSVSNPEDVVRWLRRIGRDAVLIKHEERPVPLEEVDVDNLKIHIPNHIRGYWPRFVAKALAADLGPILIFAPRRQEAEKLAEEIARELPNPQPLQLTNEQRALVGKHLAELLRARVAYHHSGLSYGARAGVIEPLAKAGQLRVVVATMGLAAGINFSLRSVALAGVSYKRDGIEQPLRPDEILQMFGRAGRRGLDDTGYILVSRTGLRLYHAQPGYLTRSGMVDWAALLSIMHMAAMEGRDPLAEAARAQKRLFATKPVPLGIEHVLKNPNTPCGLKTDAERARLARKRVRQFLNSRGEWEDWGTIQELPLKQVYVHRSFIGSPAETANPGSASPDSTTQLVPALTVPDALEKIGSGTLCVVGYDPPGNPIYGREVTAAEKLADGRLSLARWVRRLTNWRVRLADRQIWEQTLVPLLTHRLAEQKTPVKQFVERDHRILAQIDLSEIKVRVPVDSYGVGILKPIERAVIPTACLNCTHFQECRQLPTTAGTVLLWRRLGLTDEHGVPTRRGLIVSFFPHGQGLAIAAALEAEDYPLEELIYDLANLDAGIRFAGEDDRWSGRLVRVCRATYGYQTIPGYLENGAPPNYGAGAEKIVASIHRDPDSKMDWVTEQIGVGDIDRLIIEWRSLLRQIMHAPELDWGRWQDLKALARITLHETHSPTLTDLPELAPHQKRRISHRLIFKKS